jgi:2,4-dienoyl-CoA reductase-like NADH-dependent reductase (Old Yellow Enzyme family)
MSRYPTLLTPLDLGFAQLKNRVLRMDSCASASKRSS